MRLFGLFFLYAVSGMAQSSGVGFVPALTTGKLPMLAYGQGQDRLGGAKSGYIDTGVTIRVIDSTEAMYLVRLSAAHTAYINKENVQPHNNYKAAPFYLTNSWSVKGDEKFDYLTINLDERLPYRSWMEINPSKIVVELYGVQSNTNWITQLRSAKEIASVDINQWEDDVVRATITLTHNQHWGYSLQYNNKNLVIRVRRQPTDLRVKSMKVAIDAGHGGSNTGAAGIKSKTFEKDYTVRFAEELRQVLQSKKVQVLLTRTGDTNIVNADRVIRLQEEMPDFLVSLHLNSSASPAVKGVSTYYKHIGFKPLTSAILNRMLELNLNEFGHVGNFNFAMVAPTDFPSALVEVAFISNEEDEKRILDPRFQRMVAKKIYRGIKDWLREVRE